MEDCLPAIYEIIRPTGLSSPFVFDSPHSGSVYPADFGFSCHPELLAKAEDTKVDQLFSTAPETGAVFLKALFPRTYIDVNRKTDDIDEKLLALPWPGLVAKDGRSSAGHGLVRRLIRPGYPIYDRALSHEEMKHRIEMYYEPYHLALQTLIDRAHYDHGQVWHINCHSMPSSSAYTSQGATYRPTPGNQVDIVLGTRDGTTCDPAFVKEVRAFLQDLGYRVAVNNPYKGMEILRRHGDPARLRNSLQIEISKKLYLDESTNEVAKGFDSLKHDLSKMMIFMRDYVDQMRQPLAAD